VKHVQPEPSRHDRVLDRALDIVEFLRAGCPWDARQTAESLRHYLLEEAYEVADAIDRSEPEPLRDELGDLLLNLAFQIVVAEEGDRFDRSDVMGALETKMRRRHPHLYGDGPARDWEEIKAEEHGPPAPPIHPGKVRPGPDPLHHAHRVQESAARVGFDWPDASGPLAKVAEELDEVREELADGGGARLEEELGDLLFSVVNLTRLCGTHAPTLLSAATRKFVDRFRRMEALATSSGEPLERLDLDAMERLWQSSKR